MNEYSSKVGVEDDEHSYDNLCQYSIEKCELCDMVFSSRFANIIHCSQHIIIPLINQKVYNCKKCLHCFTSKSDLKTHKAKHKESDQKTGNSLEEFEIDEEVSHIDQKEGRIGQNESQIDKDSILGQKAREIGHNEPQVTLDHKKNVTDKTKRKNSNISLTEESENEKSALLKSLITKQPIVQIEDIGNMVAKLINNNRTQNESTNIEKSKDKSQKVKEKKEQIKTKTQNCTIVNEIESGDGKKVAKEKELMFSRTEKSKDIITEEPPNKIIIGKRKSADKTEKVGKRHKKSNSTGATTETEGDETTNTTVTNGVYTVKITGHSRNRQNYKVRDISPDIISLDSDSSDEALSKRTIVSKDIMRTASQSMRKFLQLRHEDTNGKDQSKTAQKTDQSKTSQKTDQSKTAQKTDQSKTSQITDQSKISQKTDQSKTSQKTDQFKTSQKPDQSKSAQKTYQTKTAQKTDQSNNAHQKYPPKNTQEKDFTKNIQQNNQSKNLQTTIWSENAQETDRSINTLIETGSDSEIELDLDNIFRSPVKKSDFRSKLQFEDDENEEELIKQPLLLQKKAVKPLLHTKAVKPLWSEDLDKELANLSYKYKSVHYDELVEPEISECQRCHMIFMNRLTLYKHEMTHLRIRRPRKYFFCRYCESYYFGNHFSQKRHLDIVHNITIKNKQYAACPVCKLQYFKLKIHYLKYHPNLICNRCLTYFANEQVLSKHNCKKSVTQLKLWAERKNPQETVGPEAKNNLVTVFSDNENTHKEYDLLLVCELCLSFIKSTARCLYDVVGEKCEVGVRHKCFYCTKMFFAVKIVKRITYGPHKMQNLKNEGKKVPQGSNALKLQSIKKRLKAMKQ